MEKVKVTKEVAEAIEAYLNDFTSIRTTEEKKSVLVAEHCGQDWTKYEVGQYAALNNITTYELMTIMVNGYEVEKSAEEVVAEEHNRLTHAAALEHDCDMRDFFKRKAEGIRYALDTLGIKIEGVNV